MGTVIHVAGTNGKGSTSAFISSMLVAGGLRTGLYTSPHLCRFTERIRIDGVEADADALAERYQQVRAVADELTFFEQVTLLGFLTFAEERVDAAVIEVGLGGRLDATNVVRPAVAVVTGVAHDHEDVLGEGLVAIAREKGGIFKPGVPAVIGACGEPEGIPLLEAEARARGAAPILQASATAPFTPSMEGSHQERNFACAVRAMEALAPHLQIPSAAMARAAKETRWTGRLERFEIDGTELFVDAAHNPHGARSLAAWVAENARQFTVVVGVSADKDADGIVAPVCDLAEHVIVTEAPSSRALPAAELAGGLPGAEVEPDWWRAVEKALARGPAVLVYGSLFLVGPVRARLLGEAMDPVTLSDPAANLRK